VKGSYLWPNLNLYPSIDREGLRNSTNTALTIVSVRPEIRTGRLTNTSRNVTASASLVGIDDDDDDGQDDTS
jgi:hypothetical protein